MVVQQSSHPCCDLNVWTYSGRQNPAPVQMWGTPCLIQSQKTACVLASEGPGAADAHASDSSAATAAAVARIAAAADTVQSFGGVLQNAVDRGYTCVAEESSGQHWALQMPGFDQELAHM